MNQERPGMIQMPFKNQDVANHTGGAGYLCFLPPLFRFSYHAAETSQCLLSIIMVVVHAAHPIVDPSQTQSSLIVGFFLIGQRIHQCFHLAELHEMPFGGFYGGGRIHCLWNGMRMPTTVLCGDVQMGQAVKCIDIMRSSFSSGEQSSCLISACYPKPQARCKQPSAQCVLS